MTERTLCFPLDMSSQGGKSSTNNMMFLKSWIYKICIGRLYIAMIRDSLQESLKVLHGNVFAISTFLDYYI
jgi:hypothetical protein